MKKITFILIFLSITLLLNAQPLKMSSNAEKEEKAFYATRDSLFAPFELDKVPTGFLKEFGVFFENPVQHRAPSSVRVKTGNFSQNS